MPKASTMIIAELTTNTIIFLIMLCITIYHINTIVVRRAGFEPA